ncbi:MAG: purine-nucleoside phosphorylase [Gammaproteobacteria bacterium]|nr:purine-nucleoside phosphorylase [Gammaproteobacteria bacterium]
MSDYANAIRSAAQTIRDDCSLNPSTAIVLGTGLSGVWLELESRAHQSQAINYSDIACLPRPTAPGHEGRLAILQMADSDIVVCSGRPHLYEGYSALEVAALVYLLHELGVQRLTITNASGSLDPQFAAGDVMLIEDHINLTGHNPVIGQDESFGVLFPDMSQAYDRKARAAAIAAAEREGIDLQRGIYAGVLGPSLETSAERRMLRTMGASCVGMSTVTEVIAANHCGMDVLGLSAISNTALGDANQQPDTIENVMRYAAIAGKKIEKLILAMLQP